MASPRPADATTFAWPIDKRKPHNYLICDDAIRRTHFLDRYADRDDVALCGTTLVLTEIEWDPRGYSMTIDCERCYDELRRRVDP